MKKRRELQVKWVVREAIEDVPEYTAIRGPHDTLPYLAPWARELQETMVVIFMNARMKIIGHKEVGRGTATNCPVDVSAIFRAAVVAGAVSIIVSHNHPSGDTTPSPQDLEVTRKIVEAGRILEIPVMDHIIVGMTESGGLLHTSFREIGQLG